VDNIGRACSMHESKDEAYGILVGNLERRKPIGGSDIDGGMKLRLVLEK
jgi:hypothetical protein